MFYNKNLRQQIGIPVCVYCKRSIANFQAFHLCAKELKNPPPHSCLSLFWVMLCQTPKHSMFCSQSLTLSFMLIAHNVMEIYQIENDVFKD